MNSKNKIIVLTIAVVTIMILSGFTYAFFIANPVQNNVSTNNIQTETANYGTITVTYLGGSDQINTGLIDLKQTEAGQNKLYLMKFSVQSTANVVQDISIKWKNLTNTFCQYQNDGICTNVETDTYVGDELTYNLYSCNSTNYTNATTSNVGTNCTSIGTNGVPVTGSTTNLTSEANITLQPSRTTYYVLLLTVKNINGEQNYNQNKSVSARLDIQVYKSSMKNLYTELSYLRTTGTQYINMGLTPNNTIIAEFKLQITDIVTGIERFFGSDTGADVGTYGSGVGAYLSSNKWTLINNNTMQLSSTAADTNTHTLYLNYITGIYKLDNNSIATFTAANNTNNLNMYLFGRNRNNNAVVSTGKDKIFFFKLWKDNNLVRDMIPVQKKDTSVLGMYDLVNDIFYTNAGTGTFEYGV